MTVGRARQAAIDWVSSHAEGVSGFRGAYFIGSSVHLPDDAPLGVGSDVDVAVVSSEAEPGDKPGKLLHAGALLEISVFPWRWFASLDDLLGSYHLAAGLETDTIIADPTGELRALQRGVARSFPREIWVRRRCQDALGKIETLLESAAGSAPWHDRVLAWLFATGVTTHVLLVAALRNPTVRCRYLAAREVLEAYGRAACYPELLALLGCGAWTPRRVEAHLEALERIFDTAAAAARTRFPFSSDITPVARCVAIDGSRALVESGNHREAVFWLAASFARCSKVLAADASAAVQREHAPAFDAVLADLGIRSTSDLSRRSHDVRGFLPRLGELAEEILGANRGVVRGRASAAW